jgi:hypothetical protein
LVVVAADAAALRNEIPTFIVWHGSSSRGRMHGWKPVDIDKS